MSSEALREAKVWLEQLASADRELVRTSGLASALLTEVARLEQERDAKAEAADNWHEAYYTEHAALAVAREREQEAWGTFRRFYDDVDKSQRIDNTGGDSAVSVTLWSWSEMRAALVDEPAAAPSAVVWSEPRQDYTGRVYRDGLGTGTPAAATLVEPEEPTESVSEAAGSDASHSQARGDSGSASAAADEPGETPA